MILWLALVGFLALVVGVLVGWVLVSKQSNPNRRG
jgi:uncharacterized protein YneF (UPF0154 family)